jgi:V8-like Glu-specific endopeptidase
MNEKNYYSLRLLGSNAFHAKGDVLKTTNKVLNIGETSDCEIRYEADQYEPERYATIVENEDGKSWRLIQRSEHVSAKIAGSGGFGFVHQLKDGDVISFDGQDLELEFHTHFDSNYGKNGLVVEQHTNKRLIQGIIGAIVALFIVVLGLAYFMRPDEKVPTIRYDQLQEYLSSVYIIRVDSVQWIEAAKGDTTLVRPTKIMDSGGAAGTAFLTKDMKLITARHCIEYWIGNDIDLTTKVKNLPDDDIVKWAILSEKFMQERENEDVSQQLRVFFSIYEEQMPDEPIFSFCSTDCNVHINRHHDGILQLADFSDDYYWRTVRPYFSDLEMELGDIVYIDVNIAGKIETADSASIAQLNQSSDVAVLGYPNNASGKKVTFATGTIKENRADTLNRVNPDIQFDANITHGFSGGPVFIRVNDKVVVAGVVSKIDTDNGIYKKAVPITEIGNMTKREKEVENE